MNKLSAIISVMDGNKKNPGLLWNGLGTFYSLLKSTQTTKKCPQLYVEAFMNQ